MMVNRKKKGLFRDIIIESDYDPLQARKCGHPLSRPANLVSKGSPTSGMKLRLA